uniref:ULP_PROTEASE domain-containing protein n=1 Tax=Steinernema glaseri TaxID=37863 RepID=A0A1I7ZDK1_9BILA
MNGPDPWLIIAIEHRISKIYTKDIKKDGVSRLDLGEGRLSREVRPALDSAKAKMSSISVYEYAVYSAVIQPATRVDKQAIPYPPSSSTSSTIFPLFPALYAPLPSRAHLHLLLSRAHLPHMYYAPIKRLRLLTTVTLY